MPSDRMPAQLIVAHRGASFDAPENTLAAFRLAWEQDADGIEADFQLTADQQIVCIHDADTARVCPNQSPLTAAETNLATLQKLDVGGWKDARFAGEKIPTLQEVLAVVPPEKQFLIEIKAGPEILPELQRQLARSSLKPEQIVLMCFKSDVIKQARNMMPQYRANWLTDYELRGDGNDQAWYPSLERVQQTLSDTAATGLGSHGNVTVLNEIFVRAVIAAGFEFHAWTIDDPAFAAHLKLCGARSLTTNRPAFLRSLLQASTDVSEQPTVVPEAPVQ